MRAEEIHDHVVVDTSRTVTGALTQSAGNEARASRQRGRARTVESVRSAPTIHLDLNRTPVFMIACVLAGLSGGALTYWAQGVLPPWLSLWANSSAPWAIFALMAGATAPRIWAAIVGALVTQWALVFGYYQFSDTHAPWWDRFDLIWLLAGVVSGVVFGLVGWYCRSPHAAVQNVAIALLPALAVGTSVEYALRTEEHYEGHNITDGVILMIAALVVVAVIPGRRRQRFARVALIVALGAAAWLLSLHVLGPLIHLGFQMK